MKERKMQTFLPYADFKESFKVLDRQRLGKQRVEAYQILRTLTGFSSGWKNHPAVKMWAGYGLALKVYYNLCLSEWEERGYKNIKLKYMDDFNLILVNYPPWLGNKEFHASHRSNLLRKNFKFYSQYGWKENNDLPYIWPV